MKDYERLLFSKNIWQQKGDPFAVYTYRSDKVSFDLKKDKTLLFDVQ